MRSSNLRLACLCSLALVAMIAVQVSAEEGEKFADIAHQDLVQAIKEKKVVLLDVNGSASYKKQHIPGAIDFAAKKEALKEALPEDKGTLIVAYCGGPKCGAWKEGAKAAEALGYTNVKHYKAGISGWVASQEKNDMKKGEREGS